MSIQYMWQHVTVTGIRGAVVEGIFKEIAITEMKHAEEIAERLASLGGSPTVKPDTVVVGNDLEEMLRLDEGAEEEAITLYKQTIKLQSTKATLQQEGSLRRFWLKKRSILTRSENCLLE